MSTYRQLTQEQRYQIYALKKTGHSRTEIAEVIGVHKATVSRELKRNRGDAAIVRNKLTAWPWNADKKVCPGSRPRHGCLWKSCCGKIGVRNKSPAG